MGFDNAGHGQRHIHSKQRTGTRGHQDDPNLSLDHRHRSGHEGQQKTAWLHFEVNQARHFRPFSPFMETVCNANGSVSPAVHAILIKEGLWYVVN